MGPSSHREQAKVEGKKRAQAFLPSAPAQMKDAYRIVGGMSGKVPLVRTLKLTPAYDVVKRKGLGVRGEVARRQREGQGLGTERKCLFTERMHGKHIPIDIKCVKLGQPPQGCWYKKVPDFNFCCQALPHRNGRGNTTISFGDCNSFAF